MLSDLQRRLSKASDDDNTTQDFAGSLDRQMICPMWMVA